MNRQDLYRSVPTPVQNLMATAYGVRELPRRHGGNYRQYRTDLAVRQLWSEEQLLDDQLERVRSMLVWCAARIPHYRELFADLGFEASDVTSLDALAQLPILGKEQVRADPQRFRPEPPSGRVVAQTTGGTTGTPLAYWATLDAVRFNYATYEARTRAWAGVRFGDRMASFHGQPIVPAAEQTPPYWRRNPAFNQLYCSVYHLNDLTLPAYVDELERFRPDVVVGYTSAVHRVASHLLAVGDVGRVRPRAVLVSSETLFPSVRTELEQAFGCKVFNSYSLGELVAYVSQCPEGHLHISTEYGVIELVDVAGRGQKEIVATGLINRGMPLVRYRTGDVAVAATEQPSCGRGLPVLAELVGRSDDVVRTPEGSVVGPAPMSLAFQRVPNLRRAQVLQSDVDSLQVMLETTEQWGPEDESFLIAELRRRLGTGIAIDVTQVDVIPRTSGGKERLIVSDLGGGAR